MDLITEIKNKNMKDIIEKYEPKLDSLNKEFEQTKYLMDEYTLGAINGIKKILIGIIKDLKDDTEITSLGNSKCECGKELHIHEYCDICDNDN